VSLGIQDDDFKEVLVEDMASGVVVVVYAADFLMAVDVDDDNVVAFDVALAKE
jgi:hypothetical protein